MTNLINVIHNFLVKTNNFHTCVLAPVGDAGMCVELYKHVFFTTHGGSVCVPLLFWSICCAQPLRKKPVLVNACQGDSVIDLAKKLYITKKGSASCNFRYSNNITSPVKVNNKILSSCRE